MGASDTSFKFFFSALAFVVLGFRGTCHFEGFGGASDTSFSGFVGSIEGFGVLGFGGSRFWLVELEAI